MILPHPSFERNRFHVVHENGENIKREVEIHCFLTLLSYYLDKVKLLVGRSEAGQSEESLWLRGKMSVQRF